MKLLEEKIQNEGIAIGTDILKVDMFLNHQMDVELLDEMGKEFKRLFENCGATKVVTIESSGIAIAVFAAKYLGLPALFAKTNVFTARFHILLHVKIIRNKLSLIQPFISVFQHIANGITALNAVFLLFKPACTL
jgi:xanthine phosphoribosyltransferase